MDEESLNGGEGVVCGFLWVRGYLGVTRGAIRHLMLRRVACPIAFSLSVE